MLLLKRNKVHVPNFEETFWRKNRTLQNVYHKIYKAGNAALGLNSISAQVLFALDYSYSMEDNYRKGKVSKLLETLLPLGLKIGNGLFIDVILFNRDFYHMPDLRLDNCQNYLRRYLPNYHKFHMGGTNYSPVLNEILTFHKNNEKFVSKTPTYVIFLTDNECSAYDVEKIYSSMNKIATENIFLQFVKIGENHLNTLHRLEQEFCNASLLDKNILGNITDEELYEDLLTRYNSYLKTI